jgi:hypothetical protein
MQGRVEISDRRDETRETNGTIASALHRSSANADYRPSANRPLSLRIGGWIANLFSWYRY